MTKLHIEFTAQNSSSESLFQFTKLFSFNFRARNIHYWLWNELKKVFSLACFNNLSINHFSQLYVYDFLYFSNFFNNRLFNIHQNDKIYETLSSSHIYFIMREQALFRNMIAHFKKMKTNEDDFVELSEFAHWWNDYDFEEHN